MLKLELLLNDFYNIFNKKQTYFEIILNLSFILILFIFLFIFYWDSINRSVINNSRCKILMNNNDSIYNLTIYDREKKNKLYDLSYDNSKFHNLKIDCSCPVGTTVNKFEIPYYDYKDEKVKNDLIKICNCDEKYDEIPRYDYKYDGDAFLIDYYKELNNNIDNSHIYTNKLYFP